MRWECVSQHDLHTLTRIEGDLALSVNRLSVRAIEYAAAGGRCLHELDFCRP